LHRHAATHRVSEAAPRRRSVQSHSAAPHPAAATSASTLSADVAIVRSLLWQSSQVTMQVATRAPLDKHTCCTAPGHRHQRQWQCKQSAATGTSSADRVGERIRPRTRCATSQGPTNMRPTTSPPAHNNETLTAPVGCGRGQSGCRQQLLTVTMAAMAASCSALDNGAALLPPLGWSNWNAFEASDSCRRSCMSFTH
jgi:hypothetical protein